MAIEGRSSEQLAQAKAGIGTGPYLAKVVSHLDPSFMSSLEVTLLRDQGNSVGSEGQTYVVKYMTPFFGSTSYEFMGTNTGNADAYNDTQKSYGMWFVPPDVGVTVMVMFVDGNPSEGYWIGCIPSKFANNMVPAIGGTNQVDISPADKAKYATTAQLPVAEVNRKANDLSKGASIDKVKRPVHPIADRFLEQGTLEDDIRGVTNSSVRRDIPNMVFGISTPGPLDKRAGAKRSYIGRKESHSPTPVPVSRLGGTQFVMDDGDDQYQRKKPASEGGVEYADILAGEKGEANIPYNEYFRVRTRTGHQILLHNSEDLIYIGNARGTTWIEMTSNGKIDIYAQDSVSIHTGTDLNIRADRDINLEAGRNINMRTETGTFHADIKQNLEFVVDGNGFLTTTGVLHVNSTGNVNITSAATTSMRSARHVETAGQIHMNGPAAATATKSKNLTLNDNIVTDGTLDWSKTKYLKADPLKSIMKRVPMHEPWPQHENFAPSFYTPANTDRDAK
jgi:hypothetical protein